MTSRDEQTGREVWERAQVRNAPYKGSTDPSRATLLIMVGVALLVPLAGWLGHYLAARP
jgi:hypothetical protein